MALERFRKEVEDFLENLHNYMREPPSSEWLKNFDLDYDIDQDFDLNDNINKVIDYWNESVAELLNNFEKGLENPWNNLNKNTSKIHDAAYDFDTQYVSPNPNFNSEKYEDNRTDEIQAVLQNSTHLDYTIGEITDKLKEYVTRLIMPQYERRVEIEDLNRNFWVIGQNLSLLNKFVLDLDGPLAKAIKDLIAEITGLWENVYRIWQAILHIAERIDDIEDDINELGRAAAKTKIQLSYSFCWGTPAWAYKAEDVIDRLYLDARNNTSQELHLTETFLFRPGDSKYYGLLPYIEKESVIYDTNGNVGYLFYLPYNKTITNKRLNKYSDEELDKIFILGLNPGPSATGEIIGIQRKFGNVPARELLKTVQAKNFVLISPQPKNAIPVLDNLVVVHEPILSALQFYRDFLYSVTNLDRDTSFGKLIENTFTWLQGGYLEYINFSESKAWKDSDIIPENIFNSYDFLQKFIKTSSVFSEAICKRKTDTIKELKELLLENQSLHTLIPDFYNTYNQCVEYLKEQGYTFLASPPYFTDRYNGVYRINTISEPESFCREFTEKCQQYNSQYSLDSNGTFSYIPTIYLFHGNLGWFEGTNFDFQNRYYKLVAPNKYVDKIGEILRSNNSIHWDLLSNTIAGDNFYFNDITNSNETQQTLKRNETMRCNMSQVSGSTEEEKEKTIISNFKETTLATSSRGGWWKYDTPNCVGNSFLHNRADTFGIWFEFVADPTSAKTDVVSGQINSFTVNEAYWCWRNSNSARTWFDGPVWSAHHIYNVDITIPFNNVEKRPYWDFIRLGKPYPSITQVIANRAKNSSNIQHLITLNDERNYISYNELLTGQNGDQGYCIDGYYGFDSLINYPIGIEPTLPAIDYYTNPDIPVIITYNDDHSIATASIDIWRKRIRNDNEIYYYGSAFINNVQYQIGSTDLINAYLTSNGEENRGGVSEGFTKISNRNEIANPVINLSYLSGDSSPQEISILVSKDTTKNSYTRKIKPKEVHIPGIFLQYDELDSNYLYGLKKTDFQTGDDCNFGVDILGFKDSKGTTLYTEISENNLDNGDLFFTRSNTSEEIYFYRQKVNISKPVNGGLKKTEMPSKGAVNTDGEFSEFLTAQNAKTMIQYYINQHKLEETTYFILTRIVYNHWSTHKRGPQSAGIYLGYIGIWKPDNTISLLPINRILTPGAKCQTCHTNTFKDLVFIEDSGHAYGHIHEFTGPTTGNWGMTAFADINQIDNNKNELSVAIYCPDLAYFNNTRQSANSFRELRNSFDLQDVLNNLDHVYARIDLSGKATVIDESTIEMTTPNVQVDWHTWNKDYSYEDSSV